MIIERVRDFYNAQLLQPFIMHVADERKKPVQHPEFIAAAREHGQLVVVNREPQ